MILPGNVKGVARIEFESAVEIAERRLHISIGELSAGAHVISSSEIVVEGDGDAEIGDGAIELSPRLPLNRCFAPNSR